MSINAKSIFTILSMFAVSALSAAPAFAGPADYNGDYALTCEQATYTLHLDIAGVFSGADAHLGDSLSVTIPCEGDAPEVAALADDVGDRCRAAGLASWFCDDLGATVADAVAGTAALVPSSMRLTVNNTTNPLNQLMGLYPARGLHTFDNGAAVGWDYALTDKPGARGVLQAVGIGVLDAAANGMAGCADAIVAGVDGRVHSNEPGDPSAGFALNAEFAVDRGLYCMAASGDDIVFANIGLTLRGVVSGDKL